MASSDEATILRFLNASDDMYEAIINAGRNPMYHREQIKRLEKEWPTLYQAILKFCRTYREYQYGSSDQSNNDGPINAASRSGPAEISGRTE